MDMPAAGVGARAGTKTVAAAERCRLRNKHSTMVGSLFHRIHFANRFVHNLIGGFHQYYSRNAASDARTAVGVKMIEEYCQLFDIRLGFPETCSARRMRSSSLTASEIWLETMEILMVEDDILSFVTFKVLGRIFKYPNSVVLEESFFRSMMEGLVEDDFHDNECLPHVESKLVDVVGGNSEYSSFVNCSVSFSISIDNCFTIGDGTSW
jgi:hypothetical protein